MPDPAMVPPARPVTRLTLLPTTPRDRGDRSQVRRYRLASVRPAGTRDPQERFSHLKRNYD